MLNAINLNTGEFAWRVPLGEHAELTARGIPRTGTETFGGSIVTAGGLVFIAGTKDERIHAFDKQTGKLLWEHPFRPAATRRLDLPGRRQYVVIAAGGAGKLETKAGDAFVAFSLPATSEELPRRHTSNTRQTPGGLRSCAGSLFRACPLGLLAAIPSSGGGAAGRRSLAGKRPGDVGIRGEETSRIHQSPLVGPTRLITNVTKPTLTVYQPPKDKNTGTAMVICPGGGYWDLYWELEGEEVAAWLNSHRHDGHHPQVPLSAAPGDVKGEPPLGPQLDAQRAVSLVRSRAAEWGIDPKRIGIVGFSAGGHLALATATRFHETDV